MNVRVVLVDDDALVRAGLKLLIGGDPTLQVVGEACDGQDAEETIASSAPDVVLMDIRMPRCDGLQATERELARQPDLAILMLTTFDADELILDALRLGARGFLLKDTSPTGLVDAIRAVMQGTSVVSPGPITSLLLQDKRRARPVPAPELGLSPRELQILRLLCAAYSNTEIAEELFVSESTVKTHVSAIMTKMQVPSRLKAVVRAYELGLVEHS